MNKQKNILLIYFLIAVEFFILTNSKLVMESVIKSCSMFIFKIFPSLFPTMIIGLCLIKNNVGVILPKFIKKIFNKLLGFNDNVTNLFIISMITGTPSNAIYINEYLNKGLISEKQAECLLCSSHFINPLFVIGGVGVGVFNNPKTGFLLLMMLWFNNFFKAFLNRKNFSNHNAKIQNKESAKFIKTLSQSVKEGINALLMIFGIVVMFSILITLISNIFNLSSLANVVINGILEMTGGVIKLSFINTSYVIKFILAYLFLNFGGICIQMQTLSMIDNSKIKFRKYFIYRLF